MKTNFLFFLSLFFFLSENLLAQDTGRFSGDLETTVNFFQKDAEIGAANTPQYDYQFVGLNSWVTLNYSYKGFDVGARFDGFYNSNLQDPQNSFNGVGIGRWYLKKKIHNLGVSVGYLYDQIGSGIIFRAFEERPLAIDNALLGLRLTYDLGKNWNIKAFGGKQKNRFDTYASFIKGANIEGFYSPSDTSKWSISPGVGVVNRTLDDNTMSLIRSEVRTYGQDTFVPAYNVYMFSVYNNLVAGPVSLYIEGAYKSDDASRLDIIQDSVANSALRENTGSVLYASLSYSQKGLGISVEGKRTEFFDIRTSPLESLNRGFIGFLPPMSRTNTYRLTSRYASVTQFNGEQAFQANIFYNPSRKLNFTLNASRITDLDNNLLYNELYFETKFKKARKWELIAGFQMQQYNQDVFEQKPGVPIVETYVPFIDFSYKIARKKTIRTEWQYQFTEQDFGSWIFGLVEYTIAPKWAFAVSDMVNIDPKKSDDIEHYYAFLASYTHKSNKFTASYVKQVEGIVCTGGICRLEPAFSGARLTVTSTF